MALVLATLTVMMLLVDARPAAADGDKVLDDLLFELQLVPLDGQEPAPFCGRFNPQPFDLRDVPGDPGGAS